ncbi:type 1 glutamine amidotransferase domain-containing protein [Actinorhabdospora filicis]|nr:type 1 glutamine amidotransferase domain-containing protein [Actinorhabdospora filicis]
MTRALIVLTSHADLGGTGRRTGFYVSEAAEPWAALTGAGVEVDLASVAGGEPPRDGEDPDDPVQRRFLEAEAARLAATPALSEVDASGYDAVFFAGGHGTMWDFPEAPAISRVAREIWERGGHVAAVCHGPAALVGVTLSDGTRLVAGKRLAAFTNDEESAVALTGVVPFLLADALTARGATHVPAPPFTPHTVIDGRLITGQNPASAAGVAEALVAALTGPAA